MSDHRHFSFPLNVYAHILTLDRGDFRYLHYGMFESEQDEMQEAQERASRMLFERLPSPPVRMLEVGIGIGTTLSRLASAGHRVLGITPDSQQILHARTRHGQTLPVECVALEDFAGSGFEWMIFQESAQYIETGTLFRKASELLQSGGHLLIMDEMALRPHADRSLPLRDDYLAQARAHGFNIQESVDLSSRAWPTLCYIQDAVQRHRERLIQDLPLAVEQIDGLLEATQAYLDKYRDGRYGYGLLHAVRTSPSV